MSTVRTHSAGRFGAATLHPDLLGDATGTCTLPVSPTRQSSAECALEDFGSFYREHFAAVSHRLRKLAGDCADDVAQEAFIAALERWDDIGGFDAPEAWVWTVARRMAQRKLTRERCRRAKEQSGYQMPRVDHDPCDPDMSRALHQLPGHQYSALLLHYVRGMPLSQVGDVLGCGESVAKVWLHRARRRLAPIVGGYEGRWVGERRWSTDAIIRLAGEIGAHDYQEILTAVMPGRGTRRELTFHGLTYVLATDDGERLDSGRFFFRSSRLVLDPSGTPGAVWFDTAMDGDQLSFHCVTNTSPLWHGIPDHVRVHLLYEAEHFLWTPNPIKVFRPSL